MRLETSDIAQAVETVRAGTEPVDEQLIPESIRPKRLRTAVGTTPPELRKPEQSDGVPIEAEEDWTWLDRIDV